jgi:fimbrial chaperone protein
MIKRLFLGGLIGLTMSVILGAVPGDCFAGNIKLSTIYLELSGSKPMEALTLENTGNRAIGIQVKVKDWSHPEGEDVLETTRDVLVNPMIFELAAGQSQIVRLGYMKGTGDVERAYRLVIQEIPAEEDGFQQKINTILKITLPLFVLPSSDGKPELLWTLEKNELGRLYARVTNLGNTHAEVSNINIAQQSGIAVTRVGRKNYVLPGQYRQWELPEQLDITRPLVLEADGKHGKIQSALAASEAGSVVEAMQ